MADNARGIQLRNPVHQAYLVLRVVFVVAPILFGVDKFFNFMVEWPDYLAPWIDRIMPGNAQDFMYVVGGIEIAAGLVVLVSPRWGSLLVAAWLGAIIVNLLTAEPPEYYDIALRDLGLMTAAITLNRLATAIRGSTMAQEVDAAQQPRAAA
jgi:uncharacterized membrane protein YphA (DoxX/SURF4 family)